MAVSTVSKNVGYVRLIGLGNAIANRDNMGLSDRQQAIVMFIAFVLPAFSVWSALGFPTDRMALGLLSSNVITGVIAALKELWGVSPQVAAPTAPPPAAPP